MRFYEKICSLFLVLSLLCMTAVTMTVTVYAHEVPDAEKKGTVTVEMTYDGKAVTGGVLTAYRVGQVQASNGDYFFVKTEAMENFSGSYKDINSAALAEDMAAYVKSNSLSACATAENKEGKAAFSDMELGLYLIVQTKASSGYDPLKPFLVSVPVNEDGHYVYEVSANGKFQLHQATKPSKPAKPTKPKPLQPNLPQTGQLNWPVPVLVVTGLALFVAGWMLRFGKKRDGYAI